MLRQSLEDWEQIVYNVGDPVDVPDDPRVRYYTGEKRGPAADFQACLDLATGEIVVPLADDDRLSPYALETALAAIGDAEWLVARTVLVNDDGIPVALRGGNWESVQMTRHGAYMLGGAIFWRKSLSDRLGGFRSEFDGAADFDLYTRFLDDSDPAICPEILYLYSDHAQTDTRVNAGRQSDATRRIAAGRAG